MGHCSACVETSYGAVSAEDLTTWVEEAFKSVVVFYKMWWQSMQRHYRMHKRTTTNILKISQNMALNHKNAISQDYEQASG